MNIFLISLKDNQTKIICLQELYISVRHTITFFITGQYKLNLNFKSFVGV
jgi:hypothetical protein